MSAVNPQFHPEASPLDAAIEAAQAVIIGKPLQVRLALCCFLAGGHLLLEDLPGVGKSTLALTLANILGLDFSRIQFTSDLLPVDIVGTAVLQRDSGLVRFQPGPIFAQFILADEINRAPPRCHSALLEAMEEGQVSVEGDTRSLPEPFFVIATLNPKEHLGTYALPESLLDRFHMRMSMGYPDEAAERALLAGKPRRKMLDELTSLFSVDDLLIMRAQVSEVFIADAVLDYLQRIVKTSRESALYDIGLSPRAGLALKECAQAWAFMHGRDHVIPDDVQQLLPYVTQHRLSLNHAHADTDHTDAVEALKAVAI